MKGILALAFLLVSSQSIASEWHYITSSSDGEMVYMDFSSITSPSPSKRRAWTLYVGKEDTTKTFVAYDCPNRESATISSIKYNAEGGVLDGSNFPKPQYSPVVPDSIGEMAFLAVCDLKQRARMKAANRRTFDPKLDAELRRNPPSPEPAPPAEEEEETTETQEVEAEAPPSLASSPFSYCKGRCAEGYTWASMNSISVRSACKDKSSEFVRGCYYWVEATSPSR